MSRSLLAVVALSKLVLEPLGVSSNSDGSTTLPPLAMAET